MSIGGIVVILIAFCCPTVTDIFDVWMAGGFRWSNVTGIFDIQMGGAGIVV